MEDWIPLIIIVAVIISIVFQGLFANRMQEIADMKKAPFRVWAWCFWVPMLGIPLVIALPDRGDETEERKKPTASSNYNLSKIVNEMHAKTQDDSWLCPDCRQSNSRKTAQCFFVVIEQQSIKKRANIFNIHESICAEV